MKGVGTVLAFISIWAEDLSRLVTELPCSSLVGSSVSDEHFASIVRALCGINNFT